MAQVNNPAITVVPVGQEIASFDDYPAAAKAVDQLADVGFPVQALTIVGTDLKIVERVTGRITWGKVLASGAFSGAFFGLMLSISFVLLIPETTWTLTLGWMVAGAIGFALAQAMTYALTGGQRDFSSSTGVVATRYGLQSTHEHATRARHLLQELGVIAPPPAPVRDIDLTIPPQYGVRIDPDAGEPQA